MKPEKLDEIASRYGYKFSHATPGGNRAYRKTDGSYMVRTVNLQKMQGVRTDRGDAGLREWLEEQFE